MVEEKLIELINECDTRDIAVIRSGKHSYFLRLKDYDTFENTPRLYAKPEAIVNLLHWLNNNYQCKLYPCGYHFNNVTFYVNYESYYVE